jgi:hypothetical protein
MPHFGEFVFAFGRSVAEDCRRRFDNPMWTRPDSDGAVSPNGRSRKP